MTNKKISSKTVEIPIPPNLRRQRSSSEENTTTYYYDANGRAYNPCRLQIFNMVVEPTGNKLVIEHTVSLTHNNRMTVQLHPDWNEFVKPELQSRFDLNFFAGGSVRYREEEKQALETQRDELIQYLYDFFHKDPAGIQVMDKLRTDAKVRDRKMQRLESPHADKIIMETAEHIKAKYKIVTLWETGEMLYYKDGVYIPGAERLIEEESQTLFQYDMRNHYLEEIKCAIKRNSYKNLSEFDSDPYLINVANGLYHFRDKVLLEHRPEYLSLNQKPIWYDPNVTTSDLFEYFLDGVLYQSQVRTMKECLAYTFYRSNPHEIYVIQVGYGWNGKGTMMNVLTALHGEENVSTVSMRDLKSDGFALADLEGKDVNMDDEMSAGVITDLTLIKKLTGRAKTRIRQKYVKAHDAKLHVKLFFSTNEVPDITDNSTGRYRREIVIIYPYTFAQYPNPNNPMEKKEDPYLEEKLTSPRELSGIFNMLMECLHRILFEQNKRVYVDMQTINERRRHRELMQNPMQFFVDGIIDLEHSTPDDSIAKDDLHKIHEKFFELNKMPPYDKLTFGKKLKHVVGEDILKDGGREGTPDPATGKRRTMWKGIKVKPEWLNPDITKQTSLLQQQLQEDEEEPSSSKENSSASSVTASGLSEHFSFLESQKNNDKNVSLEISERYSSDIITSDTDKKENFGDENRKSTMTAMTRMTSSEECSTTNGGEK